MVEIPEGQSLPPALAPSASHEEFAQELLKRGIRARLRSASLLTGQKYIDLDFLPEEPARFAALRPRYPELPTSPTSLEKLSDRADTFFAKLAELPVEEMLDDLRKATQAAREVLESRDLRDAFAGASRSARKAESTLAHVEKTLSTADDSLAALRSETGPTADEVRQTLRSFRETAAGAEESLDTLRDTLRGHDDTGSLPPALRADPHLQTLATSWTTCRTPRGDGAGQGAVEGEEVMRALLSVTVAFLALGALGACVSLKRTPEARFFALRPVAERPQAEAPRTPTSEESASIVGVLPVLLPGHLERPQFVTWSGPGEVRVDEFLRWAEPLDAASRRVLAEDLGPAPLTSVVRAPWPGSTPLRCRVACELVRFGPQPGGRFALRPLRSLPAHSERALVIGDADLRRDPAPGPSDPGRPSGHERPPRRPGRTDRGRRRRVAAVPQSRPVRRPRFPDRCDGRSKSRSMAFVRVGPRCGFATKYREIGGASTREGPGTAQFEPRSTPPRAARVLPCCDDRGEKILPLMISPEPGMPGRARVIGSLTGDAVRVLLDAVDGGVVVLDLSESPRRRFRRSRPGPDCRRGAARSCPAPGSSCVLARVGRDGSLERGGNDDVAN